MNKFMKGLSAILGLILGGTAIYFIINTGPGDVNINSDVERFTYEANQAERYPRVELDTPVEKTCTDCWDYEDIETEENGLKAKFRIAVLTHTYKWVAGKSNAIEGGELSSVLPSYLKRLDGFRNAEQFVAVGVASEEGPEDKEILRALNRADQIQHIIKPIIDSRDLYTLNLGQFNHTTGLTIDETAYQRRVIVVAVLERDQRMEEVDFESSLKKALVDMNGISYNPNNYTNFDLSGLQSSH